MDDDNNQNQQNGNQGDVDEHNERNKKDAEALLNIARVLNEEADAIDEIVADTSDRYQEDVRDDVRGLQEDVGMLGELADKADHDAAVEEAREDVEEAQ